MGNHLEEILEEFDNICSKLSKLDIDTRIDIINKIRTRLHNYSPFKDEPVDCVLWLKNEQLKANDYNPNSVAPKEMKLLEHSIRADGYTQPIVGYDTGEFIEIVDGFHRNRVGRENSVIRKRIHNYLPVTIINNHRTDRNDRMASTIRHNRARGQHSVHSMSSIVSELTKRMWSNEKIAKELGMEPDEVLRLKQVTGLASLFSNKEFSKSWDVDKTDHE